MPLHAANEKRLAILCATERRVGRMQRAQSEASLDAVISRLALTDETNREFDLPCQAVGTELQTPSVVLALELLGQLFAKLVTPPCSQALCKQ